MEGRHSKDPAGDQDATSNTRRQCPPRKVLEMQEIAKISTSHNYSVDVVTRLFSLFGEELPQLLNGTESPRELTVMTNTLKTDSNKIKDIFACQKVDVEMASWPKDVLVAKKKPRDLDLEAAVEHRAGYYKLQFETWSKLAYHKLPEWLMPAEAGTQFPATGMQWLPSQQVIPAETKSQSPTVNLRRPLCQQVMPNKAKIKDSTVTVTMRQQVHQPEMHAHAKPDHPTASVRQPPCKKAVPAESKTQDQTMNMKVSLCQQTANASTKDQVATKRQQFKQVDKIRHMKQYSTYEGKTLKNMGGKTAESPISNVSDVCEPANPSQKTFLPLEQKTMEMSKPIQPRDEEIPVIAKISVKKKPVKKKKKKLGEICLSNTNARTLNWKYINVGPKPQWVRKGEIFWLCGFDLGYRTLKYSEARKRLVGRNVQKIWLEHCRCVMKLLRWVERRNRARELAWSHILAVQKWKDCVDFLKTNPDPRIQRFIGTKVATKPKVRPTPRHMEPENYCMYYGGQGMSGMLPVLALAPFEGASVLDLCAAAGHHSILIGPSMLPAPVQSMLLQNTGMIVSNALIADDLPRLWANLHRFGVSCVIVTRLLHKFPKAMVGKFSHALVDAPCSGAGIVRKYERGDRPINDHKQVHQYRKVQRVLILKAIDCLLPGGYLVYSTSSVLVEENEAVVRYALCHRKIKLVDISLPFCEPGLMNCREYKFTKAMRKCRRVYPHLHQTEGVFLAKIKKL